MLIFPLFQKLGIQLFQKISFLFDTVRPFPLELCRKNDVVEYAKVVELFDLPHDAEQVVGADSSVLIDVVLQESKLAFLSHWQGAELVDRPAILIEVQWWLKLQSLNDLL